MQGAQGTGTRRILLLVFEGEVARESVEPIMAI
jgi:hypothetical protein